MIKYSLIFLLSVVVIFSCKKDEKSSASSSGQTTSSNSSSQQENTSESTEESGSLFGDLFSDTPTAFVEQENGKKKLQFNLEKGKTYPYNIQESQEQKLSAEGKSESMVNENSDVLTFKVQDIQGDTYKLLVTLVSKKTTIKVQGKSLTVDTQAGMPAEKDLQKNYKIYKALVGNSFTMDMTKSGTVSNIKGFDKIYAGVQNQLKGTLKPDEMKFLMEMTKKSLNPETFKEQFETVIKIVPTAGISQGETWTDKPKNSLSNVNYKVTKLDDTGADISISSTMKPDSKKQSQNGVTLSASISGNQTGQLSLDGTTGWVKKFIITTKVNETNTASDGKRTEKLEKSMISTTSVN